MSNQSLTTAKNISRTSNGMIHHYLISTLAIAGRVLRHVFTRPSLLLPSIIFPLFFFTAFVGGLSNVSNVPGFRFAAGYTAFQFVFVFLQSAAFGGVFTGFTMAGDFESGFTKRLFLSTRYRSSIVVGYTLAAIVRFAFTGLIVSTVAVLANMKVLGNGIELGGLIGLGLLINLTATLWGLGIAMRLRSIQAGPLMQTPVFLILFLAPVYVPLELLTGWIHAVAQYNPLTAIIQTARSLLVGVPEQVGIAFLIAGCLFGLFVLWARGGLRSAERAG